MHPNTEQNSLKDFFISYSDADQQWAEWIAWQLEAEKYEVFIKSWDVRPGNNAVVATHKATTQAKRTIAVLSPDYLRAVHTKAEWAAAFQKDHTAEKGVLLPVHVCECRDELGGLLSQITHIDLVGLDESAACDKLLKAVSGVRGKPETKPLFPGKVQNSENKKPPFPGDSSSKITAVLLPSDELSGVHIPTSSAAIAVSSPTSTHKSATPDLFPPLVAPVPTSDPLQVAPAPVQNSLSMGSSQLPPRNHVVRKVILALLILLIVGFAGGAYCYLALNYFLIQRDCPNSIASDGIGVTKASDGECIGISDGRFPFDTSRPDGNLKRQAADKLKAGDVSGAESLWQSGLQQDTSDAEALIYQEDQRALASGNPYITIIVATLLTGKTASVGRDDLQGAYVAQKEFNDGFKLHKNVQVRLLIANSGSNESDAQIVARQVVQAAQQDRTIVGVMGWPSSQSASSAISILTQAHIPMVSQTASGDELTGISPYFFRVAPSNKAEGIAGAHYAEQVLHAKNVALFVDPANLYSSSLATDFSQQFIKADGNHIVVTEKYAMGSTGQGELPGLLQDALTHKPDLIYFSTYGSDVSELLTNLPTSGPFAHLQVMGGDSLYNLGDYASSARANFNRLRFTAFAYPDEWEIAGLAAQKPSFFTNYSNAFDPNRQHRGSPYGFTREDDKVMLSYDATLALLTASGSALSIGGGKKNITPGDVRQALRQVKLQGVSGPIQFGSDGNAINKPFVILSVKSNNDIQEKSLQGCLLPSPCS